MKNQTKVRFALLSSFLFLLFLSGCGGGGGSGSSKACSLQSYDKSNLPAEPNATAFDHNPLFYQQWAIHYDWNFYNGNGISAEASIHMDGDHRYLGRAVKVAIIDNALDLTHEDLQNAVVKTYDVETNETNGTHIQPTDDNQTHGTEVTGVIGARNNSLGLVGVAPKSEIYFIRLPFGRPILVSEIVKAFEKAKEWGVDVINCSWGSNNVDDPVKDIIVDLANNGRSGKGTVIVFAAGNDNSQIGNDEASIPEVIAVGATNKDNLRTRYSNYGETLDVMAPGGEYKGITTFDLMGTAGASNSNYLEYNDPSAFGGTSASAPIVTGVVAQLLEANPNLTRENVYNALACSADKIGNISYGSDGFNIYYGYGKINATKALKLVR